LQDLKLELDFRHVAGYVTGDDGEGPPVDVPAVMKRLETIKRMCKSDVPSDLVRPRSFLRIVCEALHWSLLQLLLALFFVIFFLFRLFLSNLLTLYLSLSLSLSFSCRGLARRVAGALPAAA
jgi:hypothetical protein